MNRRNKLVRILTESIVRKLHEATRGSITQDEFDVLKKGDILVNDKGGEIVVDEVWLDNSLNSKKGVNFKFDDLVQNGYYPLQKNTLENSILNDFVAYVNNLYQTRTDQNGVTYSYNELYDIITEQALDIVEKSNINDVSKKTMKRNLMKFKNTPIKFRKLEELLTYINNSFLSKVHLSVSKKN